MDAATDRQVRSRAGNRCEYCRVPSSAYQTPSQIDHIVAKKHGGGDDPENLALCCFHCNSHKRPNVAGVDRESGSVVRLFNPRRDVWSDHFQLRRDGTIVGRTSLGNVTVDVLVMNDADAVALRASLIIEGNLIPDSSL